MDNMLEKINKMSYDIFEILKKEYEIYLSNDKKEFIDNIDINNLYKIIDDKNYPPIYFIDNKYYLNTYYNLDCIYLLIPFLCLRSLVDNLNPLKIGLIEYELEYLKEKYNLQINPFFKEELEVASIVSKTLLNNIPFKVIFKESDTDIVSYLVEEVGYDIGMCYYNISSKMKKMRKNKNYFDTKLIINYENIKDYLYDFIGSKVK